MNGLDKLGLAIANAGYTWTPEMRKAYEDGIKEFEAAVLAEREACAKVCAEGWKEGLGAKHQGDVFAVAIRARGEK